MKYPNPNTTFIYGICDENEKIIYIGKSNKPIIRLRQHKTCARHKTMCVQFGLQWLRDLLKKHNKPKLIILKEVPYSEWEFWEKYYISYYRDLGNHLFNISNGGLAWSDKCRIAVIKYWSKPVLQYSLDGVFIKEWESSAAAARSCNVSAKVLQRAVRGGRKSSANYMWRLKQLDEYPLLIEKVSRYK